MEFIPLVVPPAQKRRVPSLPGRRDDARKWIAAAVLLIIVVAGAAWGVSALVGGDDDGDDPPAQLVAGDAPTEADLTGAATAVAATPGTPASESAGSSPTAIDEHPEAEPTAAASPNDVSKSVPSTEPAAELANADMSSSLSGGFRLAGTPTTTAILAAEETADDGSVSLPPSARGERNDDVDPAHSESGTATVAPTATSTPSPSPAATSTPTGTPTIEPTATNTPSPTPTVAPTATPTPTPTSTPTVAPTVAPTATTPPGWPRVPVFAGTPLPPLAPETPEEGSDGGAGLVRSTLGALDELIVRAQNSSAGEVATPINGDGTGGVVLLPEELEIRGESTPEADASLSGE